MSKSPHYREIKAQLIIEATTEAELGALPLFYFSFGHRNNTCDNKCCILRSSILGVMGEHLKCLNRSVQVQLGEEKEIPEGPLMFLRLLM